MKTTFLSRSSFWSALSLILLAQQAYADDAPFLPGNRHVTATIVSDTKVLQPASDNNQRAARIGVLFKIDPEWHIYWANSGESGTPTSVQWSVPDGWSLSEVRFPAPYLMSEEGDINTFGYQQEVLLISDLKAPPLELSSDLELAVKANVSWLVCKDICLPGGIKLETSLHVSSSAPLEPSQHFKDFAAYDALTPKPASVLEAVELTKHVVVSPILSHRELAAGSTAELGLQIANLYTGDSLGVSNQLQVFPLVTAGIEFGLGTISKLGISKCELEGCNDFLVTLPIRVLPSTAAGPLQLSGILVFSPETLVKDRSTKQGPVSIQWSLETTVEATAGKVSPRFSELAASASAHAPLTYRRTSKTEVGQTSPSLPASQFSLLYILLLAFTAGMILNLMPCVLPIISIKVMGFVGQADQPRSAIISSALLFSAGILSSMTVLALVVIVLRDLGHLVGWGFQFQQPAFVLVLTIVIFLLSLGFFELFNLQLPGSNKANRLASKFSHSPLSHFFDGVLATVLSTPCTAPFLGTALAFAFSQTSLVTFAVFLSIGFGLALPYFALSTQPALTRLLPKPGEWMNSFKELMGFFLLGTVIWLLFILHRQTEEGVIWALVLLLALYFLVWLLTKLEVATLSKLRGTFYKTVAVGVFLALSTFLWPWINTPRNAAFTPESSLITWRPYSDTKLQDASAGGQAVFIDFTADWCVTCKVNEKLVLETSDFAALLKTYNVLPLKGDWTRSDEDTTRALKRFGGQGVPHYVLVKPQGEIISFPTILTKSLVAEKFRELIDQ